MSSIARRTGILIGVSGTGNPLVRDIPTKAAGRTTWAWEESLLASCLKWSYGHWPFSRRLSQLSACISCTQKS